MNRKTTHGLLLCLLLLPTMGRAQLRPASERDTASVPQFHLTYTTGVYSVGQDLHSYVAVAPSVQRQFGSKLSLQAGFAVASDFGGGRELPGLYGRSRAPRRNENHGVVAVGARASYQVNDNLWLAASVLYAAGSVPSPFQYRQGTGTLVGFSGELHYVTANNNRFAIYLRCISDNGGLLPSPFATPYDIGLYSPWGINPYHLWIED